MTPFQKILLSVLAAHVVALLLLCTNRAPPPPKRPLVVETLKLTPPPPAAAIKPKPAATPKAAPAPKAVEKPAPPKPVAKKTTPAPPKKPAPPEEPARLQWAQTLRKSLEQTSSPLPAPLEKLESESLSYAQVPYEATLVSYLHAALILPELGSVRIQLTLTPQGHVAQLVTLQSESEKNRLYIEKTLPSLILPCFNGSQSRTLSLTLNNE